LKNLSFQNLKLSDKAVKVTVLNWAFSSPFSGSLEITLTAPLR